MKILTKRSIQLVLLVLFVGIFVLPVRGQLKKNIQNRLTVADKRLLDQSSSQLTKLSTSLDRLSARSYSLQTNQVIRVLLANNVSTAQIQHSGPVYVYARDTMEPHRLDSPNVLSVRVKNGKVQVDQITSTQAIVIDPKDSAQLTFKDRVYNGVFMLIPKGNTMMIVEHINLENYLLGVVGHEMSPSWPIEALKAQAVSARTFARTKMQKKDPNYDVSNKSSDQVYKGSGENISDAVRQAVDGTRGQVLTYNDKLLQTFYHANCGGYTSDGKLLMGREAPEPLKGVSCTTCAHTSNSCWTATISDKDIENFVHKNSQFTEPIIAVKIEQRESTPKQTGTSIRKAISLRFVGPHNSVVLSCSSFRQAVGATKLKTCKIDKIAKDSSGKNFTFSGCGFGHGVGMCQDGAKGMAEKKSSYQAILKHYFPGSKLTVWKP